MGQIKAIETAIKGLFVIDTTVHADSRGFFCETYNQRDYFDAGLNMKFVQDNQSSSSKGVLRGLHYQIKYPQGKLVRVISGSVFDVAVDLRENSDTYGKWYGLILSADNHKQLYIPENFAHGFLVLSDQAVFSYKVTEYWHPNDEAGIAWNDPDIGIIWPSLIGRYQGSASGNGYSLADSTPLLLSEKDQKWGSLFSATFLEPSKSHH